MLDSASTMPLTSSPASAGGPLRHTVGPTDIQSAYENGNVSLAEPRDLKATNTDAASPPVADGNRFQDCFYLGHDIGRGPRE